MSEQRTTDKKRIIIDTGCANIASVKYAIERLGYPVTISDDPAQIQQADQVFLPGVGSAAQAMQNLADKNLIEVIQQLTVPTLGICLGMQLMTRFSSEGNVECLNLIPVDVQPLTADGKRVPHMGWNTFETINSHPVMAGIKPLDYVYYVHSFGINQADNDREYTIASCEYGGEFACVIGKNNFVGVQFHPERSGPVGSLILKNFLEWTL